MTTAIRAALIAGALAASTTSTVFLLIRHSGPETTSATGAGHHERVALVLAAVAGKANR